MDKRGLLARTATLANAPGIFVAAASCARRNRGSESQRSRRPAAGTRPRDYLAGIPNSPTVLRERAPSAAT